MRRPVPPAPPRRGLRSVPPLVVTGPPSTRGRLPVEAHLADFVVIEPACQFCRDLGGDAECIGCGLVAPDVAATS